MSDDQIVLLVVAALSVVIGFLSGVGTQWAAFKRVFGDFARLMLAGSDAIADDRIDEPEIKNLYDLGKVFGLSLVQFWKAVFGR